MTFRQTEQFTKYIKMVENDKLFTTQDKQYVVHESPEGGNKTIGYGHKLNLIEQQNQQVMGWGLEEIDEQVASIILAQDIQDHANNVSQKVPRWDCRSQREKEMLVAFDFNLGNVFKVFPKFSFAILTRDMDTQRKEYKRYYRDSMGNRKELKRRNRLFYSRYLSPMAVKAWGDE